MAYEHIEDLSEEQREIVTIVRDELLSAGLEANYVDFVVRSSWFATLDSVDELRARVRQMLGEEEIRRVYPDDL